MIPAPYSLERGGDKRLLEQFSRRRSQKGTAIFFIYLLRLSVILFVSSINEFYVQGNGSEKKGDDYV